MASTVRGLLLLVLAGVLPPVFEAEDARAGVNRGWVGPASGVFSNPDNWLPKGIPQNGDTLIFNRRGPAGSGFTPTNDLPGLRLNAIIVNDTTVYLDGQPLTLLSEISVNDHSADLYSARIAFQSDVFIDADAFHISKVSTVSINFVDFLSRLILLRGGTQVTASGIGSVLFHDDVVGTGTLSSATPVRFGFGHSLTFEGVVSAGPGGTVLFYSGPGCPQVSGGVRVEDSQLLSVSCDVAIRGLRNVQRVSTSSATAPTLTINGPAEDSTFGGEMTIGQLRCCGKTRQTVTGQFKGMAAIQVDGGAFLLQGAAVDAATFMNVFDGATLGGFGAFGDTFIDKGKLALGSPGKVGIASFPALGLATGSVLSVDVAGPSAGSGYGQAQLTGVLDITPDPEEVHGPELDVNFKGYTPPAGQPFTLIKGATSVKGTFKGLPEGATATFDGMQFRITYKGGAGHDVIITRLAGAATPAATATPRPTTTPTPGGLKYRMLLPVLAREP